MLVPVAMWMKSKNLWGLMEWDLSDKTKLTTAMNICIDAINIKTTKIRQCVQGNTNHQCCH